MGALLSDYKGLQEVTRMLGTPTIYGCFKCWHGGFWACRGKRIWCNHYAQLPAGHVHRARLSSYHNPGVAPPPRTSREGPPRLRTRTELIRKVRHPIEPAPLIAGEASPVVINGELGGWVVIGLIRSWDILPRIDVLSASFVHVYCVYSLTVDAQ